MIDELGDRGGEDEQRRGEDRRMTPAVLSFSGR
jgi:hypothetical protein